MANILNCMRCVAVRISKFAKPRCRLLDGVQNGTEYCLYLCECAMMSDIVPVLRLIGGLDNIVDMTQAGHWNEGIQQTLNSHFKVTPTSTYVSSTYRYPGQRPISGKS